MNAGGKMRRILIGLMAAGACAIVSSSAWAGAQQYLNPSFKTITASHKTVAILPFKVTIDTKRLKDTTPEMIRANEQEEGLLFQKQLYIRLLQKSADEKYTVGFQDADQTLVLLQKAGIPVDSTVFHSKDELAKILGVDAIISGTIHQAQPTSQGMALAQSFLVGVHGSTNRVDITIAIHNGADGQLLWTYDHTDSGGGFTGSIANSVDAMVKSLLKKVAGNFPYKSK
jgi:hypothetical protein